MAQPRSTTLRAKTVKRVPKVVASRARANCVPSHWPTTQPSSGTKQGSTASAHRVDPRLAVVVSADKALAYFAAHPEMVLELLGLYCKESAFELKQVA
jgi:hypothetical protein